MSASVHKSERAEHAHFTRGTPEWAQAWDLLAAHIANEHLGSGADRAQTHQGESWEYMGSAILPSGTVHSFRHRYHPMTCGRVYAHVQEGS